MTREEAIADIRDNIKPIVGGKSLDMAIEALEKKPCDDCISRQAVLAIAGDSCLDLDSYEDTREFCDEIKALPPVTPKAETVTEFADRCRECGAKYGKLLKQESCEDCVSRSAVIEITAETGALETQARVKALPPVTPQQKTGYVSIDDAMSAFNDYMCNDIEPEDQEVFLELLKDRAERSKE